MKSLSLRLVAAALATAWMGSALAADPWIVVGHKAPDTDAITAALAVAQLKTRTGQPAVAAAQGAPTDRKFNRMRPSMARVLGLETRSAKEG